VPDLTLLALRTAFQVVGHLAPATAARWAEAVFFRPARARPRANEEEFLAAGESFGFSTSRGRLAAWRWGRGPRVLLVHGWGSRAARFRVLAPALVEAGFQVISYDHPAHGASPGQQTSLVEVTAVLLEVAAQKAPLHAAVGHSLGGAAVAAAQARGLELNRAVLIAPFSARPDFLEQFARLVRLPDRARDRMRRNIEARFGMRFEDLYIPPRVRGLSTPALIVHDRGDLEIPFAEAEAIAAAWPGARLVATEGLGHHAIVRDPGVAARVAGFVRDGETG